MHKPLSKERRAEIETAFTRELSRIQAAVTEKRQVERLMGRTGTMADMQADEAETRLAYWHALFNDLLAAEAYWRTRYEKHISECGGSLSDDQ